MVTFLYVNHFEVTYKENELADLTLDVAGDKLSFDEIVGSIHEHRQPPYP